jgi:hypothetical protein
MQLFVPLEHADEPLNAPCARFRLYRGLNPEQDGVSICTVESGKENLCARVSR